MESFMKNVPAEFQEGLREAIQAIQESKMLLDEVRERFGTNDPLELETKMDQVFDGIAVTPDAVRQLEELHALHEARRAHCLDLMNRIGRAEKRP